MNRFSKERLSPTKITAFAGLILIRLQLHWIDSNSTSTSTGEFFSLGVDLQKPIATILQGRGYANEAAYNDAQGVTAAFNLNILQHLNHRFEGNFDIDLFDRCAFYNRQQHRIEMHLRSLVTQTVFLKALNYQFIIKAGETIHTEISRKFHLPRLIDILAVQTFKTLQIWTDPQDWFGLMLCQRQCNGDDCP